MTYEAVSYLSRRRFVGAACALVGLTSALPRAALAQYPERTIKMVVPWPPGGITDITARLLAQRMAVELGQTIVVENKPGASGTVGHADVAHSPADGYSVLLATNSTYAIAPHLLPQLPYGDHAFRAIGLVARSPQIFCAHPSQPFHDMAGFLDYVRTKPPESVSFQSSGPGSSSHLATELLMAMAQFRMLHVPYRGGGPAMQALLSGEVNVGFADAVIALQYDKTDKLRLMGTSSSSRVPRLPDAPPIAEFVPGFQSSTDLAMLVPAATPDVVVARLSAAMRASLDNPEVRNTLTGLGAIVIAGTPEDFPAYVEAESRKWGDVIRARAIKMQ